MPGVQDRVVVVTGAWPAFVCLMVEPSMPIRSTRPFASTFSSVMSNNWYLSEELPQFKTRTFIEKPPLTDWLSPINLKKAFCCGSVRCFRKMSSAS